MCRGKGRRPARRCHALVFFCSSSRGEGEEGRERLYTRMTALVEPCSLERMGTWRDIAAIAPNRRDLEGGGCRVGGWDIAGGIVQALHLSQWESVSFFPLSNSVLISTVELGFPGMSVGTCKNTM